MGFAELEMAEVPRFVPAVAASVGIAKSLAAGLRHNKNPPVLWTFVWSFCASDQEP